MTNTKLKIKIGESGENFLQTNNLPDNEHVTKQPAGLDFYRYRWPMKTQGVVDVDHGAFSFTIPHVLSVTGTEDTELKELGISTFNINAGITASDVVLHDEALREFTNFLKSLLEMGWRQVVSYSDPRLTGEEAFTYYLESSVYSIPANYTPTLEQWMKIKSGYWRLYAEGVFLKINFQRDRKRMDPNEPGAYLFTFELRSKEWEAKEHFSSGDMDNWQDLWVGTIKSLKKERYAKEKELIKRGFTIYTDYEEPKIHPADPVEP